MIDRKYRLARKWSNGALEKYAGIFTGKIVNVSAWNDYDKCGKYYRDYFSKASSYDLTNYGSGIRGTSDSQKDITLDLEEPVTKDLIGGFNVVFNHTTLEHIYNVQLAFQNLCLLATDAVIIVVPFSQIQHDINESYKDYWRFTPYVIEKMFKANNYTMVVCDYNSNFNAAVYLLCIGLNNSNIEKYASYFSPLNLNDDRNMPGSEIGINIKEFVRRKTRNWKND